VEIDARGMSDSGGDIEVSVVMPCLNESRTLPACIGKARAALEALGTPWEIVVADNGSTDGSQALATSLGARVVDVPKRGYGNAYLGGVAAARGRFVVMGDSDDSYDFGELGPFVERLRGGADLVMGSRFRGKILDGAMPWSHRYLGNPVLTGILNLLFSAGVSDAHCGLRAISKTAWGRLGLKTGGMEFASEMIIRSAQEKLRIEEVPITLHKDGRDRPPHLRSFSDGWRHLRFMLMFSPSWLFLAPAILLALLGLPLLLTVPFYDIRILHHTLSIHFSLLGSTLVLASFQIFQLAVFAKLVFVADGIGSSRIGRWALTRFRVGIAILTGVFLVLAGGAVDIVFLFGWIESHGSAVDTHTTALIILASTTVIIGLELVFAAFFLGLLRASRTGAWSE
jgi:glycosyltransferase involved in cell wall biosynthesis